MIVGILIVDGISYLQMFFNERFTYQQQIQDIIQHINDLIIINDRIKFRLLVQRVDNQIIDFYKFIFYDYELCTKRKDIVQIFNDLIDEDKIPGHCIEFDSQIDDKDNFMSTLKGLLNQM